MADEFDATGPLPQGLMLIEASAGTGKTYTLAALAVRSIAEENVAAASLCLVTFTEAATAELRGRLRAALGHTLAHLSGDDDRHPDAVIDALGSDPALRPVYARRVEKALAELDTAWITTIHGWCARVLGSAGVWQATPGTLVQEDDDVTETLHDVLVARYALSGNLPAEVADIARAVRMRLAMPLAVLQRIEPHDLSNATAAKQRKLDEGLQRVDRADELVQLIDDVVAEVARRRRGSGRQTFDGLLEETRNLLFGPRHGEVIDGLRSRFEVVLIDEFQDTDQMQWDIFRRAFHDTSVSTAPGALRRLVLVGDPKQSIYRFRAAELSAYLQARQAAGAQVRTLRINRRSDPAVLSGVEHLLQGTTYGDEAVRFEPVRAPEGTPRSRLYDLSGPALQLRRVDGVPTDMTSLRRAVRSDVAQVVSRLLASGLELDDAAVEGARRPLRPADIAVLTRSNDQATSTALDLSAVGVPAATASANSVLDSAAGTQWRVLLAALARPGHAPAARAAAVGWFVGVGLETMEDDRLVTPDGVDVVERLYQWSRDLERGGMPLLLRSLADAGWHTRLLARVDGERLVTDTDHIAELLQSVTSGRAMSAVTALEALDGLAAAATQRVTAALLARRIDRDDDAVQVLTIHKAKGLEFPVVLCPYLWTKTPNRSGLPHAAIGGTRIIDTLTLFGKRVTSAMRAVLVADDVPDADMQERLAEERRLAYVALTRAKHYGVVWWAEPSGSSEFRAVVDARGGLTALAESSGGALEVVPASSGAPECAAPTSPVPDERLQPALATREHDRRWRIWSFSAMKAAADHLRDLPTTGGVDEADGDDPDPDGDGPGDEATPAPVVTRLREAPGGTRFGTTVHRILERCDFASVDLAGELTERCRIELAHRGLNITPDHLARGLLDVLITPLGGPADLPPLTQLTRSDRLDELDFHLPLAGVSSQQIAHCLLDHLDPTDPALTWVQGVAEGALPGDVEGRLTGSIDLVARSGPEQQVWLADYKTNRLGPTNGARSAEVIEVMDHAHYWLQATLYLVATHRYLRWRRPDYDPDRHLVGAAYLFVRAMSPDVPGAGVIWWRPPTSAIEAVDRLLGTGVRGG